MFLGGRAYIARCDVTVAPVAILCLAHRNYDQGNGDLQFCTRSGKHRINFQKEGIPRRLITQLPKCEDSAQIEKDNKSKSNEQMNRYNVAGYTNSDQVQPESAVIMGMGAHIHLLKGSFSAFAEVCSFLCAGPLKGIITFQGRPGWLQTDKLKRSVFTEYVLMYGDSYIIPIDTTILMEREIERNDILFINGRIVGGIQVTQERVLSQP